LCSVVQFFQGAPRATAVAASNPNATMILRKRIDPPFDLLSPKY
jgi:hypothetical protein